MRLCRVVSAINMGVLSRDDVDNIRNHLFGEDTEADISLFLWSLVAYIIARIASEKGFPGKVRGYTKQQYLVTLSHQAALLPILTAGWDSLGRALR